MFDPIAEWQSKVVRLNIGESIIYHVGYLGNDIATSPTLTMIAAFASGLRIMGRVELHQKRVTVPTEAPTGKFVQAGFIYSLKVLKPINALDFDTARKAHLDSFAH